jgi:hypothetical protein
LIQSEEADEKHPFVISAHSHAGAIHELPLLKNFGRPRKRDFARLNLHLGILDQPAQFDPFNNLSVILILIGSRTIRHQRRSSSALMAWTLRRSFFSLDASETNA